MALVDCTYYFGSVIAYWLLLSGSIILRAAMAVEELGGGQDRGADDGPRRGRHLRGGEEAEEEAAARLPLRQPQEPQLVGLQILLLRAASSAKHHR